jgi:hypothetical protein
MCGAVAASCQNSADPTTLAGRGVSGGEEHGTCALALLSPSDVVVVVDSLVTYVDLAGKVTKATGCKIAVPTPKVAVVAVGMADANIRSDHWNALASASELLKSGPEPTSIESLQNWSIKWSQTFIDHFRRTGTFPSERGIVSELLVATRIDGVPLVYRVTMSWDGSTYHMVFKPSDVRATPVGASSYFWGACRNFVQHIDDFTGQMIPRPAYLSFSENLKINELQMKKTESNTVAELSPLALSFEELFTTIDRRLEGDDRVMEGPYASATWADGESGWTVHANPECKLISPSPKVDSVPVRP